MKLKGHDRRMS